MTVLEITDVILKSKKYSNVDRSVVERITAEAVPKYTGQKEIIKAIKKELHIIHESFLLAGSHAKTDVILENYSGDDIIKDKKAALELMALHTSTKERLGQETEIYKLISRHIKAEDSIIDIGCGYNPFALPFYTKLPKNYIAYDIDSLTLQTLNTYFGLAGLPYRAEVCDAAVQTPKEQADTLLLLKLFPILERQKKGRAFEIIKELDCSISIVSFPLKSTSGKEKGMEVFYSEQFENGLPPSFFINEKTKFFNEIFYILKKHPPILSVHK